MKKVCKFAQSFLERLYAAQTRRNAAGDAYDAFPSVARALYKAHELFFALERELPLRRGRRVDFDVP